MKFLPTSDLLGYSKDSMLQGFDEDFHRVAPEGNGPSRRGRPECRRNEGIDGTIHG